MADSSKSRSGRPRRPSGRKHQEYVSHVIRVSEWDFYYSRRATDPKSSWEPFPDSELANLTFVGEVVRPERCKYKQGK
jgi:hypothetical protein